MWNVVFTSPDSEISISIKVWEKNRFRAAWAASELLNERFGIQYNKPERLSIKVDKVILEDDPSTW